MRRAATPYASVYTQEKFTLKFYLINAIIEDKKIDVDFAPERKKKERKKLVAALIFVFSFIYHT